MANLNLTTCPAPFLNQADYPPKHGFLAGRFCGPFNNELSCCLPCPLEHWTYSDSFERKIDIAYWLNVPALVCQVLLLLSFVVLPSDRTHRHYLSVGLCVSLILLELSFIVPLGTKPDHCYDAVTPNDMHSDASCAWSGALLEAGAMAGTIWVLLRSLWTHLRVCYDLHHTPIYVWIAHAVGWGIPALFLAISLPITGVSYRLGPTCLPNQNNAFVTWFGWLIAFGCLAALVQFSTTGYCLWLYARHFWQSESNASYDFNTAGLTGEGQRRPSVRLGRGLAWRRVQKVLALQWRSILLSLQVIVQTVYFGSVYVAAARATEADEQSTKSAQVMQFIECLVLSGGDRNACLSYAKVLGLNQNTVLASFFMSALIGIFTFMLMARRSMLVSWYELLLHPRQTWRRRNRSNSHFSADTERKRSSRQQDSEKSPFAMTGILPEPSDSVRQLSVPEAGDIGKRHETTNLFDEEAYEEEEEEEEKSRRRRSVDEDDKLAMMIL